MKKMDKNNSVGLKKKKKTRDTREDEILDR
jgi:hypothetical protein